MSSKSLSAGASYSRIGSQGGLYVISAPSGAGKTSLVRALVARRPNLVLSVSWTTRAPRPGERDGLDYRFVDPARFAAMRATGEFLESATVFGNSYGTRARDVARERAAGRDVVLEIDWQGARAVRAELPETVSVFILPPSRASLRARLAGRGTDSGSVIERRMAAAAAEMAHWAEFDYVIVNEDFARALDNLDDIFVGKGEGFRRGRPDLAAFAAGLLESA
ncbi:MAG: guanylate kinase [Gammaproteobacteria bacterium]